MIMVPNCYGRGNIRLIGATSSWLARASCNSDRPMKSSHIDARMTDAVLKVIDLLVANDIRGLVRLAGGTRFSTEEDILGLERELGLYGCTLVRPPPDAFKHMSVIEVANAYPRKWA